MIWLSTPLLRASALCHLSAILWALLWPSQWLFAALAVGLNHGVILFACVWPRSRLLGPNVRRLSELNGSSGEVGLTFDDGPDPQVTNEVAGILDQYSAKATFFCIGSRVERHPEVVADLIARGHSVENHTQRHLLRFAFLGPKAAAREIDRAQAQITHSSGIEPEYFRAPAGIRAPWTQRLLEQRGLRLVSWSRRGFDTVSRNSEAIVRRLTSNLVGGEILLLHDLSSSRDASGRPVVLSVLPRVLEELARLGLQAVALPRSPVR